MGIAPMALLRPSRRGWVTGWTHEVAETIFYW